MKNPAPLSSLIFHRNQQGFFRVTAIVLSLGLVGAGGLAVRQVKAYQRSTTKHHMATVKSSVKSSLKDCGCGSLAALKYPHKLHARNASYTPNAADANDGTDNYDQAVSLKAGQRLGLGVSDPSGSIQPGGIWKPEFGTVDANGIYTAPSFTPPEGLDHVQYTDSNGNDVFINVRILPNPAIANSDQTPTTTFDYMTGNTSVQSSDQTAQPAQTQPAQTQSAQTQSAQAQPVDTDTPDGTFAPDSKTIVVLPGETPAPPEQINSTTSLAGRTVNGTNVLVLPAQNGGGDTTGATYAQPLDETPQQVTLLPSIGAPGGPCTGGETSNYGNYTTTVTPEAGLVNLGDLKVDAGIKADIAKIFGINLSIGAVFHPQGKYYDWKRTHLKYVYTCIKGRWVLEYTRKCDSVATSLTTTPPWFILYAGYPRNNQPLLPYSPDACHP